MQLNPNVALALQVTLRICRWNEHSLFAAVDFNYDTNLKKKGEVTHRGFLGKASEVLVNPPSLAN